MADISMTEDRSSENYSPESCIYCGGTLRLVNGEPCPQCSKMMAKTIPIISGVPAQYQGVAFDKSFLPEAEQKYYGTFMEELLSTIISDYQFYQKNWLICSRPNSGKTVWAYNLYSALTSKGCEVPPFKDVIEVRNILSSFYDKEEANLYSTARCAVLKVPRDFQSWMLDVMASIIERRVRSDGFTIFLFGGKEDDIKYVDKAGKLALLKGTGSYNTIQVKSF